MSLTKVSFSMIQGAVFNVLDYGADPSGTTDSAAAIQAAVTAASSSNNVVYIPNGTYLIGTKIVLPFVANIIGESWLNTVLQANANNMDYVIGRQLGNGFVTLKNLRVKNVNKTGVAALVSLGLPGGGSGSSYFLTLQNLYLEQNLTGKCLELNSIIYCNISDIRADGGDYGIYGKFIASTTISNSVLSSCEIANLYLEDCASTTVVDCAFYSQDETSTTNHLAILDGCRTTSLQNCVFEPQTSSDVAASLLIDKDNSTSESTYISVLGCRFVGVPNSFTNNVVLGTTNVVYNTLIQDCQMWTPNSPNVSVVCNTSGSGTQLINCNNITAYADPASAPITYSYSVTPPYVQRYTGVWSIGADALPNGTTSYGTSIGAVNPVNGVAVLQQAVSTTSSIEIQSFYNPNGKVGSISLNGSATAFNTSSDQRLKKDLGVAVETDVIANTKIHNFEWADGTVDRGVFAQEAHQVKPSAVKVGSDELNEQDRPINPWAVDYSKYVPDIIVELQALRKEFQDYKASHP
jgi:hypothetical protein